MALVAALAAVALGGAAPGAEARCEALARHPLAGGRVQSARPVSAAGEVPPHCRVVAELRPNPQSRIGLEVWLPLRAWSGRYVQLGTGGFAGAIPRSGLAAEMVRGNAAAATDTGHAGADGFDAGWAAGAPQKLLDYGHLSVGVTAVAAQDLTGAFYGTKARRRYFVGCSNGGRQALMAAERYPDLWDGVLAGAPAVRWTGQLSSFAWTQRALRVTPGALIPRAKLPLIQAAALAGCGPRAEVVDGIPSDPRACAFQPRALQCADGDSAACLTAAEVQALTAIVEGARDPDTGAPLAFGFEPTSAAAPGGWDHWIVNPDRLAQTQLTFAEQFFGRAVLDRPGWRVEDLRWPQDLARARALAPVLDPGPDLARFRARGGKLLIYTGWADPAISPRSAIDYYERLKDADFARLFLVPGMLHCQGGPAPSAFGQAPMAPAFRPDARHDVRRALEMWVEQGEAPERLTAVKYVDDDPTRGVASHRTIRAYRRAGP